MKYCKSGLWSKAAWFNLRRLASQLRDLGPLTIVRTVTLSLTSQVASGISSGHRCESSVRTPTIQMSINTSYLYSWKDSSLLWNTTFLLFSSFFCPFLLSLSIHPVFLSPNIKCWEFSDYNSSPPLSPSGIQIYHDLGYHLENNYSLRCISNSDLITHLHLEEHWTHYI